MSIEVEPTPSFCPDATVERIALVPSKVAAGRTVLPLSLSMDRVAVVLGPHEAVPADASNALSILMIPQPLDEESGEADGRWEALSGWVNASEKPAAATAAHAMIFQGVRLWWSWSRAVIAADPERMASIRDTLVEFTAYEAELLRIERKLQEAWPHLEGDMDLALRFGERERRRSKGLGKRFLQVTGLRSNLARIGPYVHAPHQYPPTLASQLAERLRDRTRMAHRHEAMSEQLDVVQSVYDVAVQRASDYGHARSGNILEWMIILLLLVQVMLSLMELFAGSGT